VARSLKNLAREGLNALLDPLGIGVVRRAHDWEDHAQFLPFEKTIEGAHSAGVPLGDWIEATYNVPGTTQDTIDHMSALGVFGSRIERVCEIGPGSGRYLEKTIQICHPSHYEIYETAPRWAQFLAETYGVVLRAADGHSLSETEDESIDLVQAHKVFVCTPFITTCRYYREIGRVLRLGGWAAFDTVTEACLDEATLERWMYTQVSRSPFPAVVPKLFTIEYLAKRGLVLVGSFIIPMKPGRTECMVFRKLPVVSAATDQTH
jgi:hypothetical protein